MLHTITQELRTLLSARAAGLQCNAGRAADREAALLWLTQHTGNGWGVCVTVGDVRAVGEEVQRRHGMADVTVRLFLAMTPGLPEDADKRAESLQLCWMYVWSLMARIRWGRITAPPVPEDYPPGTQFFVPRDGFLDGNQPMLPGSATFARSVLKVTGGDGNKESVQELMVATQEWTTRVSLPIIAPATDTNGGKDFYLSTEATDQAGAHA